MCSSHSTNEHLLLFNVPVKHICILILQCLKCAIQTVLIPQGHDRLLEYLTNSSRILFGWLTTQLLVSWQAHCSLCYCKQNNGFMVTLRNSALKHIVYCGTRAWASGVKTLCIVYITPDNNYTASKTYFATHTRHILLEIEFTKSTHKHKSTIHNLWPLPHSCSNPALHTQRTVYNTTHTF